MRYLLKIEYDGSSFQGYQQQPNALTVQGCFSFLLEKILKHRVNISCAGRTDKGVHALMQLISFETENTIPKNKILDFLSRALPASIKVNSIEENSINVKSRKYLYRIRETSLKNPFNQRYYSFYDIDRELFKKAMMLFLGEHDFRYFSVCVPQHFGTIKKIMSIDFIEDLDIIIEGNSFLRGMVRMMIGTAIAISQNVLPIEFIEAAFSNPKHTTVKKIASPNGLYLKEIIY